MLDLEPEPGMRVLLEMELLLLLHFGLAPEVWPHLEADLFGFSMQRT